LLHVPRRRLQLIEHSASVERRLVRLELVGELRLAGRIIELLEFVERLYFEFERLEQQLERRRR
jgi:hypothetical protein